VPVHHRPQLYKFASRRTSFFPWNGAGFTPAHASYTGINCALLNDMKWLIWIRRGFFILSLYAIAVLEGQYLPRYGIEWMLTAIGATAFLAGLWVRSHWDL
jgi:hypothetical protein